MNSMIESPETVLRRVGRPMQEMDLVRACYGSVIDTNRRGNAGRKRAVGRVLEKKAGVGSFVGSNNARYWFLKSTR